MTDLKKTKRTGAYKAVLASTAALTALVGHGAKAQETSVSNSAENDDVVVVTGTRLKRSALDSPAPVTVITAEDIALSGQTNLSDLLNELPALGSTSSTAVTGQFGIGNAGVATADLRRLGVQRTLVLVDGKRHVGRGGAGLNSTIVDFNTIPVDLVERVEVLTGGASAVYGSDAVSGVVNVILKKNFEGLTFNAQGGISQEGDAENGKFSMLAGANFDDGRGNITFFASYLRQDNVLEAERSWRDRGSFLNPEDTGVAAGLANLDGLGLGGALGIPQLANNPVPALVTPNSADGIPDRILASGPVCNFAVNEGGVLYAPALPGFGIPFVGFPLVTFDENNNSTPVEIPTNISSLISGGDTAASVCNSAFRNFVPDYAQATFGGAVSYEISPMVEVFADVKFSHNSTKSRRFPVLEFASYELNVFENPYLLNGLDPASLAQLQTLATVAGSPNIPYGKYQTDLGVQGENNERNTFRFVGGLRGALSDVWDYELAYVYGQTDASALQVNTRIEPNYRAAIDAVIDPATGEIVCRENLPGEARVSLNGGCVPLNPLGRGQISEAARDFVMTDVTQKDKVTQEVVTFALTGDSSPLFTLPAGPIGLAAGYEYRSEETSTDSSFLFEQNLAFGVGIPSESGGYNVHEAFFEASVPLLRDTALADYLGVDGAVRFASYSQAGDNTTWRVGLEYAPAADLKFRGTFSKAVRVPSISDAFGGTIVARPTVSDPCASTNITDPTQPNRAANCAALGLPAGGVDPASGLLTFVETSGNPDLEPERAETFTGGLVFTPEFLEGFSLTADYWDIRIDDAISAASAQTIVTRCADTLTTPDATFCDQIERDPATGVISKINAGRLNISALEASGVDIGAAYRFDPGAVPGRFNISFVGTYLINRSSFPFQNEPDVEVVSSGLAGDPKLAATLNTSWNNGPLTVNWELRYIGKGDTLPEGAAPETVAKRFVDATVYNDIQANYQIADEVQVYGGVNNLFNKELPQPLGALGGESAGYDRIGRFFYIGARLTF